jgi:hypothetical protein
MRKEVSMSIAKTIVEQIRYMDRWALGAWGAKNMMALPKGLSFKTTGAVKWKGTVTVTLDEGKDLYVVKFTRLRKLQVIVDKIVEDVFVEDLVSVIDSKVG